VELDAVAPNAKRRRWRPKVVVFPPGKLKGH
jgi:hypothetical protein